MKITRKAKKKPCVWKLPRTFKISFADVWREASGRIVRRRFFGLKRLP